MKKFMALLLALSVTLCLCACASSEPIPDKPGSSYIGGGLERSDGESEETTEAPTAASTEDAPATEETTEAPTETQPEGAADVPAQDFSADAGTSIDVLREEIAQGGAVFGVGYVGYYEYNEEVGIDFGQWYASAASPFAAYYPFFSEIDANHTVGDGGYLYCILGGEFEASVTVTDGNGQTLYSASNGDPILLFCDAGGDGQTADLTVTVTAADGTVCHYAPTLDELDYPQLLLGDERQLLSWIIQPAEDATASVDAFLAEGWLGINEYGIAGDDVMAPQSWSVYMWDEEKQTTVEFLLTFCPNPPESGAADGEVLMQSFYEDADGAQAEWQGWWTLETELDQPSLLQLDLMLMDGEDQTHYKAASVLSETYYAMIHPSGEILLLIPQSGYSAIPFMGPGVPGVELMLEMSR